jgi:hypothetical protein
LPLPEKFTAEIQYIPYVFIVRNLIPDVAHIGWVDFDEYRVKLDGIDSTTPSDGFVQVGRYLLENIQNTNLPLIADFLNLGRLGREVYNNENTIFDRRLETSLRLHK